MQDCKANTVDLWLLKNSYIIKYNSLGDNFIPANIELRLMEAFCKFPYLTENQLREFPEKFGLSLDQILNWFSKTRLQNNISWNPLHIDYAKSIIKKHDEKKKQKNGDRLRKVGLNNGNETTNMPSMDSAASNRQVEDLNSASSSGNLVDIFILFIYV